MKKQVTISGKDYFMKSSAYTQFKYKNDTGRGMLQDLKVFADSKNIKEDVLNNVDNLAEILLRLAYTMIEEADSSQVTNFEEFLKGLDGMFDETDWIEAVIELAASPISRGNKTVPPSKQ